MFLYERVEFQHQCKEQTMTEPTQDMLDRAFEAGRTAERIMTEIRQSATSSAEAFRSDFAPIAGDGHVRHLVAKASTMAAAAPKAPKATTIARGVKAAPKTRTKGVKSAIAGLITSGPMTVDGIIEQTGFKKNSVISTLMDLKKKGIAMQDGKAWIGMDQDGGSGNSETGAYAGS
jgi:hypothetical protein